MLGESNALKVQIRVPTEAEASLIVQSLMSQSIAARAVGGFTSGFRAEAPGDVSVLVRHDDLAQALTALATMRQEHSNEHSTDREEGDSARHTESDRNQDITFGCEECGKAITFPGERCGYVGICPHCGSYVDVPEDAGSVLAKSTTMSPAPPRAADVEHPKSLSPGSRTTAQLWIEVVAILCLAYVPWMFGVLSALNGWSTSDVFLWAELSRIVTALEISLPLLVILSLGGEPWSRFGIVRPKWIADVGGACVLCFFSIAAYYFVTALLPDSMLKSTPSPRTLHPNVGRDGIATFVLVLVAYVASGFVQELVMRAYLIVRLERLLRSTALAIVVTSVLFASYHLYQGVTPAIGAAVGGFVYAIWFCSFRRLWPLCLAHALGNLITYLGSGH